MSDLLSQLRSALGDRYHVEREIGAGGMATVFAARDLKHDRMVAVKVLRPELAAAVGAERFLTEIRVTANLQHPHILPLHDSGERDGLVYYVMPLVEGESLTERIRRDGQLRLEDAVRIASEVADALSAAHARGVIHRDVKPSNILLSGGHALVTDFGIARAVRVAGSDRLTATGLAVGTLGYMSPEQAGGEEVDERTDVYALGCVTYEMLAGEPPFAARTTHAMLARQIAGELRSVTTVRPALPPALDEVLRRATAPAAADRYASVQEFAAGLVATVSGARRAPSRRLTPLRLAAALVVTAAIAVAGYVAVQRGFGGRETRIPALAVLPFRAIDTAEATRYWGVGISEEIRAKLSRVQGVRVMAVYEDSSRGGSAQDLSALAKDVHADLLLDGTVRTIGPTVRVTAYLLEADGRSQRWAETYDREASDIFRVQSEIAARVVRALGIVLSPDQADSLRRPAAGELRAYEQHLRGRVAWAERSREANRRAIAAFEEALRTDSTYARSWAGLADAHLVAATYGWGDAAEEYGLAEGYARRALALDPGLADAHATVGMIAWDFLWDWPAAEEELHRALSLDPSYATGHSWLALSYAFVGRGDEAWAEAQRAIELDPLSPIITANVVAAAMVAGRFDDAIRIGEGGRRRFRANVPLLLYLGFAYAERGRARDAVDLAEGLIRGAASLPGPRLVLARARWQLGEGDGLRQALADLERVPDQPDKFYALASVHALLGDRDAAFRYLEQAFAARAYYLTWLKMDPNWVTLRDDPRYRAALERRGFPTVTALR